MEIFRPAPLRLHRFFLSFSGRATIVSPVVSMKLIGCQFDLAWENQPANYAAVRRLLAAAPPPRGALVALPEMFATGFSMHVEAIVQPPGGADRAVPGRHGARAGHLPCRRRGHAGRPRARAQ